MNRVRFAGVHIVYNFTVEDEDGDVSPLSTQPFAVPAKTWRTEWETGASKRLREQSMAQVQTDTKELVPISNGSRARKSKA